MNRRQFLASCAALAAARHVGAAEKGFLDGLQAGANLGRWISQYDRKSPAFDTYIREDDLARIAGWGMDHVRLPVDCDFFETAPYKYSEERLGYVDNAITWARKHRLKLMLDLHSAPGYFFGDVGRNKLFTDAEMQARYLDIWRNFAVRYKQHRDFLAFELLNEVVEAPTEVWNGLVRRAAKLIREIDPTRWIIYGGTDYSSIDTLKDLVVLDDPRILYTFHFYNPILFTHQRAEWNSAATDYEKFTHGAQVDYPGQVPQIAAFAAAFPRHRSEVRLVGQTIDKSWLRKALQPALDFRAKTGRPVHCGEFGVLNTASTESKARWYADFCDLLREFRIPRTMWTYKEDGFGLVDERAGAVVNEAVVRAAVKRW
jgi:hypothetical protein